MAVLTASLLILEAGLMMFEARDEPRAPLDTESEDSNESIVSDPSVNMVKSSPNRVDYTSDHLDGRTEFVHHPFAPLRRPRATNLVGVPPLALEALWYAFPQFLECAPGRRRKGPRFIPFARWIRVRRRFFQFRE